MKNLTIILLSLFLYACGTYEEVPLEEETEESLAREEADRAAQEERYAPSSPGVPPAGGQAAPSGSVATYQEYGVEENPVTGAGNKGATCLAGGCTKPEGSVFSFSSTTNVFSGCAVTDSRAFAMDDGFMFIFTASCSSSPVQLWALKTTRTGVSGGEPVLLSKDCKARGLPVAAFSSAQSDAMFMSAYICGLRNYYGTRYHSIVKSDLAGGFLEEYVDKTADYMSRSDYYLSLSWNKESENWALFSGSTLQFYYRDGTPKGGEDTIYSGTKDLRVFDGTWHLITAKRYCSRFSSTGTRLCNDKSVSGDHLLSKNRSFSANWGEFKVYSFSSGVCGDTYLGSTNQVPGRKIAAVYQGKMWDKRYGLILYKNYPGSLALATLDTIKVELSSNATVLRAIKGKPDLMFSGGKVFVSAATARGIKLVMGEQE